MKVSRGFSFVELLAVIMIISILAIIAAPNILVFYRAYKFYEYAFSMESAVRWSKLAAMELTTNVGICVDNNKLITIRDIGESRSTNPCSGSVIKSVSIDPNDTIFNFYGSGATIDPRGFAISPGNVCFSNGEKYLKICIGRFGSMRTETGQGGCTPCS